MKLSSFTFCCWDTLQMPGNAACMWTQMNPRLIGTDFQAWKHPWTQTAVSAALHLYMSLIVCHYSIYLNVLFKDISKTGILGKKYRYKIIQAWISSWQSLFWSLPPPGGTVWLFICQMLHVHQVVANCVSMVRLWAGHALQCEMSQTGKGE